MIRNVVLGRLRPGTDPSAVEPALAALRALDPPGLLSLHVGLDAGLRAGNWDYALTLDFADAESYRAYDTDAEHERVRRELFAPVSEEIARVQFEVRPAPGPPVRRR